jgi:1-acyl-sn-glycerol-3-phosphate acyltransferase
MLGTLRFVGTVTLAAIALVLLLPFHLIAIASSGRATMAVAQLWQRFVCFLIGVRVTVTGEPAAERPLLLLANHTSWLDIPVLASVAPVSFIAKKEVANWPVVGFLAKAQRSVFVDRSRRQATGTHAAEVAGRLTKGDIMVLFAEGTSSDGNKVLPFRSALVGAAQQAMENGGVATVQPVAVAYPRMLGLPLGRQHRPLVAWYGGTDLLPHLRRILSEGGIDVHVVFGPARKLAAGDDRKAVTQAAGEFVRRLVAALNAGRPVGDVLAEKDRAAPSPKPPFPLNAAGDGSFKERRTAVDARG